MDIEAILQQFNQVEGPNETNWENDSVALEHVNNLNEPEQTSKASNVEPVFGAADYLKEGARRPVSKSNIVYKTRPVLEDAIGQTCEVISRQETYIEEEQPKDEKKNLIQEEEKVYDKVTIKDYHNLAKFSLGYWSYPVFFFVAVLPPIL